MLVRALVLVTNFVAALLFAGWLDTGGTRSLVTALRAGESVGPVSGTIAASTSGVTHGTDIWMFIRALIRGTDFYRAWSATLFDSADFTVTAIG